MVNLFIATLNLIYDKESDQLSKCRKEKMEIVNWDETERENVKLARELQAEREIGDNLAKTLERIKYQDVDNWLESSESIASEALRAYEEKRGKE